MLTRMFKQLYAYRELLFALAGRDIRVKYKQAAMGVAWAFFLPVVAVVSGVVIRLAMAILRGQKLPLEQISEVMVRSVLWLLFASVVGTAAISLIANINLVTKIYFPRQVLPLSALIARLFDFAVSVVGVVAAMVILPRLPGVDGVMFTWSPALLWVPVFLVILLAMVVGLSLLLAAANLFFRDVKYIVEVLLRFGIFFSGVFLFVRDLDRWGQVLLLNPLVPLFEATSSAIVYGRIDPTMWPWIGYSAAWTVGLLFVGVVVFERAEYLFAEYA